MNSQRTANCVLTVCLSPGGRSSPHIRTGSGGFHVYLKHPGWRVPTLNAKNSKGVWPWPGLDVRGDGGYAVLLGRNHNGPYRELRELIPDPFEALPLELFDFLRNHSSRETVLRPAPTSLRLVKRGERVDTERLISRALEIASRQGRNNGGIWLACQLRDNGYDFDEAASAISSYRSRVGEANTQGQRERYTEAEMMASLREAYSRPPREPWAKTSPQESRTATVDSPNRRMQPLGQQRDSRSLASDSGSLCLYVGHTGEPLSPSHYGRVPNEVLADRRLSSRDVRVYAVLASFTFQGNVSQVDKRRLATLARCAERLVVASLKKLAAAGHIRKDLRQRRGQRGRYELLSPVFGAKQRAGVEDVAVVPDGRRHPVSARRDQATAWTSSSHAVATDSSAKRLRH
jgi:hypothetical protein